MKLSPEELKNEPITCTTKELLGPQVKGIKLKSKRNSKNEFSPPKDTNNMDES